MSTNFIATKIRGLERGATDRVKQIEKLETLLAKVQGPSREIRRSSKRSTCASQN